MILYMHFNFFFPMKRLSNPKRVVEKVVNREIDWELRPGGMLVQKRNVGDSSLGPIIKIKVSHGSYLHDLTVPAQSTFGELKRVLANQTGLEPKEQRLLFGGKEKDDEEFLHIGGVKEMSKLVLLEDPASKERKLEEMKRNKNIMKAYEAVSIVKANVDKLSEKVVALATKVRGGTNVVDKEFVVLTELLMVQLLKLDTIQAEGVAKVQRRVEVRRVQSLVETIDSLKARNSSRFSSNNNSVSVKWERFESGVGSLSAPTRSQSSTKMTKDWELFD